ncbi:MAG: YfiT family bacillithiol transferase, partial [Ferruginibacter sp.]
KYPVGKYIPQPFSGETLDEWLSDIETLPTRIELAVQDMDEAELETPYREGGWTVKQLIHHVADSHMNAFIRFKLGLTEVNPEIKPYDQDAWALMADTEKLPVNISLTLLHALHKRWVVVLENIKAGEWERTVYHPEHKKEMTLWFLFGMYAWHSRHHLAHITHMREEKKK